MGQKYSTLKRACPVCEKKTGAVMGKLTYALFDDLEIPGVKNLVQCGDCDMLFDDVAFTERQLDEYYRCNEHYAATDIGGAGGVSDDNKERYDRIIDMLNPGRADLILDYGCGQGGLVARCRQRGLTAVGIEPSAKSREVAQSSGLPVFDSMDALKAEDRACRIYAVVFSHVLEHLLNPMHLVRICGELAEDAWVYLEVPDADSYLAPNTVRWEEMYFEHLSHFRQNHLQEFARRSGIEVIKEYKQVFSTSLDDIKCLVLLGRFSGDVVKEDGSKIKESRPFFKLTALSADAVPKDGPLALWGVSQYAMLLLGSYPGLKDRIHRLFDASPAKIGRSINGVVVESSANINTLPADVNLLIPKSKFLTQMCRQLHDCGYRGDVRII